MSLTVKIKKKLGSFDLDVEFDAGREVLALLGSSGCGKSMQQRVPSVAHCLQAEGGAVVQKLRH